MSTATNGNSFSTASRIKALGLSATDSRKALNVLALSEALIDVFFGKPETKAAGKQAPKIKPVLKAQ